MEFAVLGGLEVRHDGEPLPLGGPQQRSLLALLLLNANRVVSADRLVDSLWAEHAPRSARALLQGCVAQLRRVLRVDDGDEIRQPLVTRPPGYLVVVRPGELDVDRFEQLAGDASELVSGRTHGPVSTSALARAEELWAQALSLWRGPALDDIPLDVCRDAAAGLEERRLVVLEERIDAGLRLGRQAELVAELQQLVLAQPLRERLWAQLMLALYASDRRADALATYHRLRDVLVDELGVEPGATVRQTYEVIVAGGDALTAYVRLRSGSVSAPAPLTPPEKGEDSVPAGASPPPGRSVPALLPASAAAFTGRGSHLRRLDELVRDAEQAMVTAVISGTAGVGKTALAVHWAHQRRDAFPGGQLYVDLRGYSKARPMGSVEALAGFLVALGVAPDEVPVEPDRAAGLYRTLMAGRRVLVLLDNVHTAEQVRPLLPGTAGCMVVITSRHHLSGLVAREGAHSVVVDMLAPDEAYSLLTRLVGQERVDAEPDSTQALCGLCAHLPLALRIGAANLVFDQRRSIADQVVELGGTNRLESLSVLGDPSTAVRAAFDSSYAALEPDARRMFRLLGLVPGHDVTVDAAAALAGHPPVAARSLLERLMAANLLDQHAPGRYAFHDLLRLYAAERANADDTAEERAAAVGALAEWYVRCVDAAGRRLHPEKGLLPQEQRTDETTPPVRFDEHAQAMAWLDSERSNLVAVARHAAEHGPGKPAWQLAAGLRGYYWLRLHTVDWQAVSEAGLSAAETSADDSGQAASHLGLADLHRIHGRYQLAIEHYTHAATFANRAGWSAGEAIARGAVGTAHFWRGQLREAAQQYREALAIDEQSGRVAGQASLAGNLGLVYSLLGDLRQAADQHTKALALHRQLGSGHNIAVNLANLGEVCHGLGLLDQAVEHLSAALSLHREVGDRGAEAESLGVLAAVHRDSGRYTEALDVARSAVSLAGDTAHRPIEATTENTLASILDALGQHSEAVEKYLRVLDLARETETKYAEIVALVGLAVAYGHLGQPEQAGRTAQEALALARSGGFRVLEGRALAALADVRLAQGHLDEAIANGRSALALHRDTGDRLAEARTGVLLGRSCRARGCAEEAVDYLRRALELFTDIGAPGAVDCRQLLD